MFYAIKNAAELRKSITNIFYMFLELQLIIDENAQIFQMIYFFEHDA